MQEAVKSIFPKKIEHQNLVVICDSREQKPLDVAPLRCQRGSLTTGDYSIKGMENLVAIERKSLPDLLGCIGQQRERFEREIQRLLSYPHRGIIVESSWEQIEAGSFYNSRVHPNAVIGSLLSWQARGIPIMMLDSHERAGKFLARYLFSIARHRYAENLTLMENLVV